MFKSLIAEILASGMTQAEVAARLGISQPTVSDISRGVVTDPRASIADGIRSLHSERCPSVFAHLRTTTRTTAKEAA